MLLVLLEGLHLHGLLLSLHGSRRGEGHLRNGLMLMVLLRLRALSLGLRALPMHTPLLVPSVRVSPLTILILLLVSTVAATSKWLPMNSHRVRALPLMAHGH